jgi:hypothetical protein
MMLLLGRLTTIDASPFAGAANLKRSVSLVISIWPVALPRPVWESIVMLEARLNSPVS